MHRKYLARASLLLIRLRVAEHIAEVPEPATAGPLSLGGVVPILSGLRRRRK